MFAIPASLFCHESFYVHHFWKFSSLVWNNWCLVDKAMFYTVKSREFQKQVYSRTQITIITIVMFILMSLIVCLLYKLVVVFSLYLVHLSTNNFLSLIISETLFSIHRMLFLLQLRLRYLQKNSFVKCWA